MAVLYLNEYIFIDLNEIGNIYVYSYISLDAIMTP